MREKVLDTLLHHPCVPAYQAVIHTFAKAGQFKCSPPLPPHPPTPETAGLDSESQGCRAARCTTSIIPLWWDSRPEFPAPEPDIPRWGPPG